MTDTTKQLLSDWRALSSGLNRKLGHPPPPLRPPPPLAQVRFRAETVTLDQDGVEACDPIREGWVGWLRRESWVGTHLEEDPGPSNGAPLDGEWVSRDGASSARLLYDGAWRLVTLREDPAGAPALRERVRLVGSRYAEPFTALRYAVYWGFGKDSQDGNTITRIASRFLGFAQV
jgi:hypothetical protein